MSEAATAGVLLKKVVLKTSQNLQEGTFARSFFIDKVAGKPATLLKKRLWHRCFPVNFEKSLKKTFSYRTASSR